MTFLIPLGLLGLLSILALIIIYIIRPNYQQKHISSTFVWKLSLKYKRKKLPTSKLRNILIFLCQVLILTSIAGILAMPVILKQEPPADTEIVAVIDSSASMYARSEDGATRYQRALEDVVKQVNTVTDGGGVISVIIAGEEPEVLGRKVSLKDRSSLLDSLDDLILGLENGELICSFGSADIERAMQECREILSENNSALVYLYSDAEYNYLPDEIISKRDVVVAQEEWNAAILNAHAELEDNFYVLTVEVACYGMDRQIGVQVSVDGANPLDGTNVSRYIDPFSKDVFCDADATKTVIFRFGGGIESDDVFYYDLNEQERFYAFDSIHIDLLGNDGDSLDIDDTFNIYGGRKEAIKIEYFSSLPNPFFHTVLLVLRDEFSDRWDLQITEVKQGDEPVLDGFDFYIFEHEMPDTLPKDGAVLLVDPLSVPNGLGLRFVRTVDLRYQLPLEAATDSHPLLKDFIAEDVTISRYNEVTSDPSFDVLLTFNGQPILLSQKDGVRQIAVLNFSLHYSNLATLPEMYIFMYNMLNFYFPTTIVGNSFEVNEEVLVQGRGSRLTVTGADKDPNSPTYYYKEYKAVPNENGVTEDLSATLFDLSVPGTYRIEQESYFGGKVIAPLDFYVKIPARESNIFAVEDGLESLYPESDIENSYDDLLVYLAAALVALLFVEWWLQSRANR